jgi:protein-ribulosamine 3-kinase
MNSQIQLLQSIKNGISGRQIDVSGLRWVRDLPGGDINQAALLQSGNSKWFLKYHQNAPSGMFAAESFALQEITQQKCIRVPCPVAFGIDGSISWLVLEFVELTADGSDALLGEQLADLHSIHGEAYGWPEDNFIGRIPQLNKFSQRWCDFWRDCRIKPQLEMARTGGHGTRLQNKGEHLLDSIEALMDGHRPSASLLHGDLWAGNKAFTPTGQPLIYDPASYYGDRETDIAMSRLFGGFSNDFYVAYDARLPLTDGHQLRAQLYNLYHMLNHLNLFGSGYLSRCENMIDSLLCEVR